MSIVTTHFFVFFERRRSPRHWLPAAAESFALSHVFLPDRDAALEFDLDLRFPDDDLLDQRPHDGRVIRTHDRAVFDAVLEGVDLFSIFFC